MLLISVDYYLVAKIQRIYETTKFNFKNNTRDTQNIRGSKWSFCHFVKMSFRIQDYGYLYNYI